MPEMCSMGMRLRGPVPDEADTPIPYVTVKPGDRVQLTGGVRGRVSAYARDGVEVRLERDDFEVYLPNSDPEAEGHPLAFRAVTVLATDGDIEELLTDG